MLTTADITILLVLYVTGRTGLRQRILDCTALRPGKTNVRGAAGLVKRAVSLL